MREPHISFIKDWSNGFQFARSLVYVTDLEATHEQMMQYIEEILEGHNRDLLTCFVFYEDEQAGDKYWFVMTVGDHVFSQESE